MKYNKLSLSTLSENLSSFCCVLIMENNEIDIQSGVWLRCHGKTQTNFLVNPTICTCNFSSSLISHAFNPILLMPPKSLPYKPTAWKSFRVHCWLKDEVQTPWFNIRDFPLLECSLALSLPIRILPKP